MNRKGLLLVKAIRGTSTLDGREFPMDEMKIAIPRLLQLGGLLITGIISTETRWLAFPRMEEYTLKVLKMPKNAF